MSVSLQEHHCLVITILSLGTEIWPLTCSVMGHATYLHTGLQNEEYRPRSLNAKTNHPVYLFSNTAGKQSW